MSRLEYAALLGAWVLECFSLFPPYEWKIAR